MASVDDIYNVLVEIRNLLQEMRGDGPFGSLSDLYDKMEEVSNDIRGDALYNQISDVVGKIGEIGQDICTKMGDISDEIRGSGNYDLSDIYQAVESAAETVSGAID